MFFHGERIQAVREMILAEEEAGRRRALAKLLPMQKEDFQAILDIMALLLSSGVPILDGLAITGKTAGNKVVEKAILDSRISISQGKTVAEPLRESKIFPPLVCQMVAVGESTGGLDGMLKKVAELYEEEVDDAVNNLTSMPFRRLKHLPGHCRHRH